MAFPSMCRLLSAACLPAALLALSARAEIVLPDVAPGAATAKAPDAPAAVPAFADHAVFGDKDHFHGRFVSFSAKEGVVWRRKDCAAEFTFRPDELDRVELRAPAPRAPGTGEVALAFNNGDSVSGKLIECTAEKTVVETVYGGRLEMPTKALRAVSPARVMPQILSGVGQAAQWQYFNGGPQDGSVAGDTLTIINSTGAGRSLPLPPKFRLEMELDARAQNSAQFIILASPIVNGNHPRDGYYFQLPGPNGGNQGRAGGNQGQQSGFPCAGAGVHKIAVFVDSEAKTLTLVVNGKKVWTRTEQGAFPAGKVLAFPPTGTVKVSKLALYGNSSFSEGSGKRPASDVLVFNNGDKVQGALVGIRDGKVSFKSEFATLEAPLDRLERLEFSAKCDLSPKPAGQEIRVEIGESDRIVLTPESVKDGTLVGKSAVLGACTIRQDAVRRMVFNLGAPFRAKAAAEEAEGAGAEE